MYYDSIMYYCHAKIQAASTRKMLCKSNLLRNSNRAQQEETTRTMLRDFGKKTGMINGGTSVFLRSLPLTCLSSRISKCCHGLCWLIDGLFFWHLSSGLEMAGLRRLSNKLLQRKQNDNIHNNTNTRHRHHYQKRRQNIHSPFDSMDPSRQQRESCYHNTILLEIHDAMCLVVSSLFVCLFGAWGGW